MASLRRLAKDHASLRASLPPNYLFPPSDESDLLPDDLTQLFVHLTGSDGTPYSSGLWLLHLKIPPDYPKSPPKATFKTRIFHPNVEESTGAVCLETLKRDWDPKLTLKDILITISCLLIQPNPDSALNEKAGVLVREDYDGFVRQARLMTRIHAPIPDRLHHAADEARSRGEDDNGNELKRVGQGSLSHQGPMQRQRHQAPKTSPPGKTGSTDSLDSTKENKPCISSGSVQVSDPDLKEHVLGKRSLAEAVVVTEGSPASTLDPDRTLSHVENGEPPRKSPKHHSCSQANGRELKLQHLHEKPDQVLAMVAPETISSQPASMPPSASNRKMALPKKYRSYARIGIKRL